MQIRSTQEVWKTELGGAIFCNFWPFLRACGRQWEAVEGFPAAVSLYVFLFPECREVVEASPGWLSGTGFGCLFSSCMVVRKLEATAAPTAHLSSILSSSVPSRGTVTFCSTTFLKTHMESTPSNSFVRTYFPIFNLFLLSQTSLFCTGARNRTKGSMSFHLLKFIGIKKFTHLSLQRL